MATEILNRIANYLFLEWCENFDVPALKIYYSDGLDAIHAALDQIKNEQSK